MWCGQQFINWWSSWILSFVLLLFLVIYTCTLLCINFCSLWTMKTWESCVTVTHVQNHYRYRFSISLYNAKTRSYVHIVITCLRRIKILLLLKGRLFYQLKTPLLLWFNWSLFVFKLWSGELISISVVFYCQHFFSSGSMCYKVRFLNSITLFICLNFIDYYCSPQSSSMCVSVYFFE